MELNKTFWKHSLGVCTLVPNAYKFLYVHQSVSWLTYFLKTDQYRDIFCPGCNIFLKFFWDIPWMFSHYFPIIENCLYICWSVSGLNSSLKLDKCRDISWSGRYVFLKFFWDIPWMFVHYFQIIEKFSFVCQSFSWLTSLIIYSQYRYISRSEGNIFLTFL